MPRLLLEYASGRKAFVSFFFIYASNLLTSDKKARGAVVGALSLSDKTYGLSQELRHALGLQPSLRPSPYLKVSPEIATFTRGIQIVKVPEKLNVNEAASLFEVWNKNKSFHTREFTIVSNWIELDHHSAGNDELFLAKYTESGGNPRDFVWKGLLSTLQT